MNLPSIGLGLAFVVSRVGHVLEALHVSRITYTYIIIYTNLITSEVHAATEVHAEHGVIQPEGVINLLFVCIPVFPCVFIITYVETDLRTGCKIDTGHVAETNIQTKISGNDDALLRDGLVVDLHVTLIVVSCNIQSQIGERLNDISVILKPPLTPKFTWAFADVNPNMAMAIVKTIFFIFIAILS